MVLANKIGALEITAHNLAKRDLNQIILADATTMALYLLSILL